MVEYGVWVFFVLCNRLRYDMLCCLINGHVLVDWGIVVLIGATEG